MPVVPFLPTPPREERSREFTPAQEPWALMAAAQMDADGRLMVRSMKDVEMPESARSRTPEGYQEYEDVVDRFIKSQGLEKGERFRVPGTNDSDPRIYEYLGPNSGGRKDWRELRSKGES